jgi:hypothetical protein
MEAFKRLWSFTSADEEHRDASATSDGESGAATRITVELREDQAGRICDALESLSNGERLLASRRVKDEDALARLYRFTQVAQLLHQLIVECCPTRRVNDQKVSTEPTRRLKRTSADLCHWSPDRLSMNWNANSCAEQRQLLCCGGAAWVGGNKEWPSPLSL